jgi:anti-sigma B factor antagonist
MVNAVEVKSASPWIAIVSLVGEHDLGDYTTVKTALTHAAVRAENVIVDLTECTFIDSTVLATMINSGSIAAVDGGRVLVVLPPEGSVQRLAQAACLDEILPTYDALAAAMASIDSVSDSAC